MALESFAINHYEVHLVAPNNPELSDVYGFIHLYWQEKRRATLWFYRDSVATIPANSLSSSSGDLIYNAYFGQAALRDSIDLLRNESAFFKWAEASRAVLITTGKEPVGEAELSYE